MLPPGIQLEIKIRSFNSQRENVPLSYQHSGLLAFKEIKEEKSLFELMFSECLLNYLHFISDNMQRLSTLNCLVSEQGVLQHIFSEFSN